MNADACIGCGICFSKCPVKAIGMSAEEDGWKAAVSADYCIGCGVCQTVCPLPDGPAITVSGASEQILVSRAPWIRDDEEEKAGENADEGNADESEQIADEEKTKDAPAKRVAVPIPELCVGCGVCAFECPVVAIKMVGDHPNVNADVCIGCGVCSDACPVPNGPAIVVRDVDGPTFLLGREEVDSQG